MARHLGGGAPFSVLELRRTTGTAGRAVFCFVLELIDAMGGSSYDEVDLEDMEWNAELGAFTYQCPCGDLFQITPEELRAGEEIGNCPSCSLVITVVYDPDDLSDIIPEGF